MYSDRVTVTRKVRRFSGGVYDLGLHVVKKDDLARTGIEAHHAYFWPHIEVVLASGRTIEHDFKIVGVLY